MAIVSIVQALGTRQTRVLEAAAEILRNGGGVKVKQRGFRSPWLLPKVPLAQEGAPMRHSRFRLVRSLSVAALALWVGACATQQQPSPEIAEPSVLPTLPPAFPPQDLVGRWGLAAYHVDSDRPRIEAA